MLTRSRKPTTGPTWPDGTPRSQRNAFDRAHYVGQIDWSGGAKAAIAAVKTAKELVAGQDHELPPMPAAKGSMGHGIYVHARRGASGRKKLKEQGA